MLSTRVKSLDSRRLAWAQCRNRRRGTGKSIYPSSSTFIRLKFNQSCSMTSRFGNSAKVVGKFPTLFERHKAELTVQNDSIFRSMSKLVNHGSCSLPPYLCAGSRH
ncbi:hypothetical protein IQ07DRAFT_632170, partial [Pyrenochaeta sp. DS3sAY3a]